MKRCIDVESYLVGAGRLEGQHLFTRCYVIASNVGAVVSMLGTLKNFLWKKNPQGQIKLLACIEYNSHEPVGKLSIGAIQSPIFMMSKENSIVAGNRRAMS